MVLTRKPVSVFRIMPTKKEQGQSPARLSSIDEPLARPAFSCRRGGSECRAVGLSPSQDLDRSAEPQFLRVSALRGGTLTDVKSVVITEQNAIFVPDRNSDAHSDGHTRQAAWHSM